MPGPILWRIEASATIAQIYHPLSSIFYPLSASYAVANERSFLDKPVCPWHDTPYPETQQNVVERGKVRRSNREQSCNVSSSIHQAGRVLAPRAPV
jgi:hypothetical protein